MVLVPLEKISWPYRHSSFLDTQLYSIDLYVYSYVNIILFYLLFYTLKYVLKLGSMSFTTLFFFKIVLAILGPLQFHMNLRNSLTISTKVSGWGFRRYWGESLDQFENILTTLHFLIYVHGIVFHIFSSLILFKNILQFLECKNYAAFVKVIMILLFYVVNVVFLMSVSKFFMACIWKYNRSWNLGELIY